MAHRSTESAAAAGRARWAGIPREQRDEEMKDVRGKRVNAAVVDAKLDLLGAAMLDQFAQLRAELAELRAARDEHIAA